MVNCAVKFCKNNSRKHNKRIDNITFHRFPKQRELREKWKDAIKRSNWEPDIRSYICSAHFKSSAIYETKGGLRKMVHDAVPELLLEETKNTAKKEKRTVSGVSETDLISTNESKITVKNETSTVSGVSATNLISTNESKITVKIEPTTESGVSATNLISTNETTLNTNRTDTPRNISLKRQIIGLKEIARRRRLRCNSLYMQINRLKRKVTYLNKMITDLLQNVYVNQQQSDRREVVS